MTVVALDPQKRNVAELLAEAQDVGFDSLVLIGVKDGKVTLWMSDQPSCFFTLGAIEVAKDVLLTHMKAAQ